MKKKIVSLLLIAIVFVLINGCSSKETPSDPVYHTITGSKAKEMMDKNSDVIILDVRTQEEFDAGHIEGALLLPYTEISDKAETTLPDKTATILVYCRTGRRSSIASKNLAALGYSNIYDFGGIQDWDYGVVTNSVIP